MIDDLGQNLSDEMYNYLEYEIRVNLTKDELHHMCDKLFNKLWVPFGNDLIKDIFYRFALSNNLKNIFPSSVIILTPRSIRYEY
jgi:hypothetical protein